MLFHSSVVGRYRLLAAVGHGGMSDVYVAAALGPAGFQKLLVVKELRPPLAQDPDFLAMFLDEARLAARLSHPNIVQTYEVFSDAGRYFIAMEYLEGQPLHRVLAHYAERGRAPLPEYLRLLADTCAGLHHAHELVDYDGTALSAKARDSSAESRVGLLKGKLGYMAPEQARGERIDRRADVFAVGVMLWELIAGRRMWRSVGEVEVLKRLVAGEIPELRGVQRRA
jgi:serine/threonine-protein kinase